MNEAQLLLADADGTFAAALGAIRDRDFLASTAHKGQAWRADRNGAWPEILEFERRFLRRLSKLGVPMFSHCIVRSPAMQNEAFVRGHSRARAGQSPHQKGAAVDIVHGRLAWELPRRSWDLIGFLGIEVAEQAGIPIVWGGHFNSLWDPAHWELRDWRALPGKYTGGVGGTEVPPA